MLRAIGIAIVALLVALALYVATRPDSFRVQRTATINAPPDRVYPLIADFHAWPRWSPWEQIDPALQRTYGGAENGKGATYAWQGNKDIGSGRMEIVDETPPSRVVIKLDFIEPFEAHNNAEFTLQPNGGGSTVTWAMYGPNTTLGKLMGLFFDMDTMVGEQFDKGLANLKSQVAG